MNRNFPKEHRLLSQNDFRSLKENSSFQGSSSILAFYKKFEDSSKSRLGITVSRKYGNAVKRNRFKRIIREIFRCSDFKYSNLFINIVPNLKTLRGVDNYTEFEAKVKQDFPRVLALVTQKV